MSEDDANQYLIKQIEDKEAKIKLLKEKNKKLKLELENVQSRSVRSNDEESIDLQDLSLINTTLQDRLLQCQRECEEITDRLKQEHSYQLEEMYQHIQQITGDRSIRSAQELYAYLNTDTTRRMTQKPMPSVAYSGISKDQNFKIRGLEESIEDWEMKYSKLERKYKKELKEKDYQITEIKEKLSDRSSKKPDKSKKQLKELTEKIEELEESLEDAERTSNKKDRKIKELEDEIDEVQKKCKEAKDELDRHSSDVINNELKMKAEQMKALDDLELKNKEFVKLQSKLSEMESEQAKYVVNCDDLQRELKEAKDKCEASLKDNEKLKNDINDLKTKVKTIVAERENIKNQMEETEKKLNQKIKTMNSQLGEMHSKNSINIIQNMDNNNDEPIWWKNHQS